MLKKKEEGRKFQETHFHSTMRTLQMGKANGCNCVWYVEPPKDEDEVIKCNCFVPPPRAVVRNN